MMICQSYFSGAAQLVFSGDNYIADYWSCTNWLIEDTLLRLTLLSLCKVSSI